MSKIITIGLDIAKHVFHAHGTDERGRAVFSKRISRGKLLDFFEAQPSCMVALEACGGAQSRLRKSEQGDKWSFGLTAGKIGPRIRRDDEQTSTPESFTGLQGEGGAGSHQGRPDDSPTGRAFRRSR